MGRNEKFSYLKPQPRVWFAILGSALLHAGLVAMLIIGGMIRDSAANTRETAKITALLRKGKPRPKDWLPRKKPAPAPAPPREVRPDKNSKPDPDKRAEKTKARPRKPAEDYTKDMAAALQSLATQKGGGKGDEEPEGSPNGVEDGNALVAQKGSEYMTKVYKAVKAEYAVPEVISQRERMFLSATVIITVDTRGNLKDFSFEKNSDNPLFDSAIEGAVRRAAPFPPPPPELADKYASEGIGLEFTP